MPENPERGRESVSETTRWGFIGDVRSAVRHRSEVTLVSGAYDIVISGEPTMVVITEEGGTECRFTITGIGTEAEVSQWVGRAGAEPGQDYEPATEEMTAWARHLIHAARNE